ncbi:hypothetical protein TacPo2_23 [Pantoea bacteriophage TacPo2]
MANGITVEIRDYDKNTLEWVPFNVRSRKAFFMHLWAAEGYRLDVNLGADSLFPSIYKPHSKMNVAIRGNNGKFRSYRELKGTEHERMFEVINALPNI